MDKTSYATTSVFEQADVAYKQGRKKLIQGDWDGARALAQRLGDLAQDAKAAGLDPKNFYSFLDARGAILNLCNRIDQVFIDARELPRNIDQRRLMANKVASAYRRSRTVP